MQKVTSADGTSIACEASGDGPPLIVVGGAFNDRGSAAPLAEVLAPHFTVVRYDRRGRGESGDTTPYEAAREVEDLAAVISTLGGEVGLYGHSSGGALALRAAEAGLPVSWLALYEVPYVPDDESRKQAQQHTESLKALLAEGRRADAVIEFMTRVGLPPEMAEGMRHAPMFPSLEGLAHTLAYDADVLDGDSGSPVPEDLLRSVGVPALVMYGGAGPESIKVVARRVSELLPGGELLELEGQTHDVAPDVVGAALVKFGRGQAG